MKEISTFELIFYGLLILIVLPWLFRRIVYEIDLWRWKRRGDYLPEFDWDRRKEDENG